MGQFLQINGDYNIKTKPGGRITLDAGIGEDSSFGTVEVVGNLIVAGNTTSITSTNLEIVDRILTLNKGESGPGVTQRFSGIEIDRGSLPDSSLAGKAAFVFDEQDSPQIGSEGGSWIIAFGTESGYSFQDSNLKLRRILTDPLTDNGNLTLIANGVGVVSVAGTTNYEDQVTAFGDDALTNKKYVDDAILNNPTFQIRSPGSTSTTATSTAGSITGNTLTIAGDVTGEWGIGTILVGDPDSGIVFNTTISSVLTGSGQVGTYRLNRTYDIPVGPISLSGIKDGSDTRVIIADKQILNPAPGSLAFHNSATGYSTFSESAVSIIVDRGLSAQFYSDRVLAQDLTIINNEIRAEQDVDVYINTSGTGKLRTNFAMRFDNVVSSDPMHENNTTIVYSKNISTGNTGLYFVSNNTTVGTVTDELISKNRALVYSMLF